jgi:protein AATF/BFR2
MSRKTLAEELAELANPAPTKGRNIKASNTIRIHIPHDQLSHVASHASHLFSLFSTAEFDPDADIFGSGPALEASDDELLPPSKSKYVCERLLKQFVRLPSARIISDCFYIYFYRGKERSRLRGDIQLPGKEYSGRRSSRAAVFGQDDEEEDEEEEEDDSEEDEELEEEEEDSELENGGEYNSGSEDEEEDEEEDNSDQSEEEEEDGNPRRKNKKVAPPPSFGIEGDDAEDDDEAAALEREYREMQQKEADAMSGLQERASKERKKGLAVRAQRSLWDSGLELRILLQKALQSGNRLPQPEGHRVAVAMDPEIETGLQGLARDAAAVAEDLLGLLSSMEEQHPAIGEAAEAAGVGGTKRKQPEDDSDAEEGDEKEKEEETMSDKLWSQLDEAYQRFVPFRDASIDRWHRKTVLASGSAARGGLKVLNQSVSSQVQLLMRDSQRVVERTRLPKRLCRPLCSTEEDQVRSENFGRVWGAGSFTC